MCFCPKILLTILSTFQQEGAKQHLPAKIRNVELAFVSF